MTIKLIHMYAKYLVVNSFHFYFKKARVHKDPRNYKLYLPISPSNRRATFQILHAYVKITYQIKAVHKGRKILIYNIRLQYFDINDIF